MDRSENMNNSEVVVNNFNEDITSVNDVAEKSKELQWNVKPSFYSDEVWKKYQFQFPWLFFAFDRLRCKICDDAYKKKVGILTDWVIDKSTNNKVSKVITESTHRWNISRCRILRHAQSQNHNIALSALDSQVINKSNFVNKAISKNDNLMNKSEVEDRWLNLKKKYHWLDGDLENTRCIICEESYKMHKNSMIITIWTCPELKSKQSKSHFTIEHRLDRHEKCNNHLLAVKFANNVDDHLSPSLISSPSIRKSPIKNGSIINVQQNELIFNKQDIIKKNTMNLSLEIKFKEKRKVTRSLSNSMTPIIKTRSNSLVNTRARNDRSSLKSSSVLDNKRSLVKTVTPSLQSPTVPVLTNVDSSNTLVSPLLIRRSRKSAPIKSHKQLDNLPIAISLQQYATLKSRFPWLLYNNETSFLCELCLDSKISIDFECDSTLPFISRLILSHSHSDVHISNLDARGIHTTRLQMGINQKINYKQLLSGTDNNSDEKLDIGSWSCPQCKSTFDHKNSLIEHISLCDFQSTEIIRELSCPCNPLLYRFNTITKLDLHALQEHSSKQIFHCYICSVRCNRLLLLYNHMLIHHLIEWDPFGAYIPNDVSSSFVECIFCSITFASGAELTNHYSQSQCNKFLQPSVLIENKLLSDDYDKLSETNNSVLHVDELQTQSSNEMNLNESNNQIKSNLLNENDEVLTSEINVESIDNDEKDSSTVLDTTLQSSELVKKAKRKRSRKSFNSRRKSGKRTSLSSHKLPDNNLKNISEYINEKSDKVEDHKILRKPSNRKSQVSSTLKSTRVNTNMLSEAINELTHETLSKDSQQKKDKLIELNEIQDNTDDKMTVEVNLNEKSKEEETHSTNYAITKSKSSNISNINEAGTENLSKPEPISTELSTNVNRKNRKSLFSLKLSEIGMPFNSTDMDEAPLEELCDNSKSKELDNAIKDTESEQPMEESDSLYEKHSQNVFSSPFLVMNAIEDNKSMDLIENNIKATSINDNISLNEILCKTSKTKLTNVLNEQSKETIDIVQLINNAEEIFPENSTSGILEKTSIGEEKCKEISFQDLIKLNNIADLTEELFENIKNEESHEVEDLPKESLEIISLNHLTVYVEKMDMVSNKRNCKRKLKENTNSVLITPEKGRRIRIPSEKLKNSAGYVAESLENKKRQRVPSEKLKESVDYDTTVIDEGINAEFIEKKLKGSTEKLIESDSLVSKTRRRRNFKLGKLKKFNSVDRKTRRRAPFKKLSTINELSGLYKSQTEKMDQNTSEQNQEQSKAKEIPVITQSVTGDIKPKSRRQRNNSKRSLKLNGRGKKALLNNNSEENRNKRKSTKKIAIIAQSDTNEVAEVLPESEINNDIKVKRRRQSSITEPEPPTQSPDVIRLKKSIKIQSQLSPPGNFLLTYLKDDECIPAEISFMDRMKRIRQLKKIRTEQQREQMMAVDRTVAEINEKVHDDSLLEKSQQIQKLLTCEQYSMKDLKNILHNESKKRHRHETDDAIKPMKRTKLESVKKPKEAIFNCEACDLKFVSIKKRNVHIGKEHKKFKLFKCKICEVSVSTQLSLKKHALKFHPDNVSEAVYGKENNADVVVTFQCSFCLSKFPTRYLMNSHITNVHMDNSEKNKPQSESTSVACPIVIDEFLEKLIEANPINCSQQCSICSELMDNEFEMVIHTIEHNRENDINFEANQFACPKCCRLFFGREGKTYLKDHYNIIHLQKPYPSCDECKTEFPSTWCYYEHKRTIKNCAKKNPDQLIGLIDPYEQLNDPLRLAFVCSRCQTLVAGGNAQKRFLEHENECCLQLADDEEDDSATEIQAISISHST